MLYSRLQESRDDPLRESRTPPTDIARPTPPVNGRVAMPTATLPQPMEVVKRLSRRAGERNKLVTRLLVS